MADEPVDRLYAAPLDRFVAERNALAKELRREGDRERADEVAKLPKPTLPVWTVNQLARRRTAELRRLLRAADALRSAHGGRDATTFRRASGDLRSALDVLVAAARDVLRDADRPATEATLGRVASTLRAAAGGAETRPLLEAGTLTTELEGGGFDPLAGLVASADPPRRARVAPARDRAAERRREREARLAEARRAAEEAAAEAAAARREADRLERRAETARRRLERLERD